MSETHQTAAKEQAKSDELMKQSLHALQSEDKNQEKEKAKVDEDMSITEQAKHLHKHEEK